MESKYIEQSKQDFAELLIKNGNTKRAKEIIDKDVYEPIYDFSGVHEHEETSVKKYNEMVNDVCTDVTALIIGYRDAAKDYHNLMANTVSRLNIVKKDLLEEKEKLEDINILCNKYTDFNSVKNITQDDLYGSFSYDNNIIAAKIKSREPIKYNIIRIDGNGYEGNANIYKDEKFLSDTLDTSNRAFINDDSEITVYEYSRITASNSEKETFQDVNIDTSEAKFVMTLSSETEFNKIIITSSSKDTIISSLAISDDDVSYKTIIASPIHINESNKFEDINYISGSGLLSFPSTTYLRIAFESNGTTDDIVAFEKTEIVMNNVNEKVLTLKSDVSEYVYDASRKDILMSTLQFKE